MGDVTRINPPCTRCGEVHLDHLGNPGCKGHNRSGGPCRKTPMRDTHVCRNHGGKSLGALAKAAERRARRETEQLMATLGVPIETDPITALHNLICWSAGHVEWYRQQLQRYMPEGLVWGQTEVTESDMHGLTITEKAEVNAWLHLYNQERQFLATTSAKAIHAGLAEREVRLAEQQGALLTEVIRRVLSDLGLTPEQQQVATAAVPRHLREVGGRAG